MFGRRPEHIGFRRHQNQPLFGRQLRGDAAAVRIDEHVLVAPGAMKHQQHPHRLAQICRGRHHDAHRHEHVVGAPIHTPEIADQSDVRIASTLQHAHFPRQIAGQLRGIIQEFGTALRRRDIDQQPGAFPRGQQRLRQRPSTVHLRESGEILVTRHTGRCAIHQPWPRRWRGRKDGSAPKLHRGSVDRAHRRRKLPAEETQRRTIYRTVHLRTQAVRQRLRVLTLCVRLVDPHVRGRKIGARDFRYYRCLRPRQSRCAPYASRSNAHEHPHAVNSPSIDRYRSPVS